MTSLRARMLLLCLLVSALCTSLCVIVAFRALEAGGGDTSLERVRVQRTEAAIVASGLATGGVAAVLGAILVWRWMRPLGALVDACRARTRDPSLPLPAIPEPQEAAVLRDALQSLLDSERAARESLARNLERETAVNAVHQRFLAQLAHEFAQPIRALAGTIELLRSQGGRLDPERMAEAHDAALRLEERFQEVLGLAADHVDRAAPHPRLAAARYLGDLAAILRPQAERLGVALQVDATDDMVEADARLLSPILVNLAANGIRAAAASAREPKRLTLRARVDPAASVWIVEDSGAGIAAPLAERITAACARGEVLPAEPGMGLGLALALANARALGGTLRLVRNGPDGAAFQLALPPPSAGRASSA